jgi:Sodium/hydrogen exchanger family
MHVVETVLFLVVLGTVVAAFAGRLRVPPPSLLVLAGLIVGLLPGVPPVQVTPDVVSLVVLPPLLYAASEELPWRDLRAVWRPVAILAVGLVLASAAAAGGGGRAGGGRDCGRHVHGVPQRPRGDRRQARRRLVPDRRLRVPAPVRRGRADRAD